MCMGNTHRILPEMYENQWFVLSALKHMKSSDLLTFFFHFLVM